MRKNGSPDPVFETDEHCTYFLTTLPTVVTNQVTNQVSNQVKTLVFNDLESILAFTNHLSDQVSDQVSEIITNQMGALAGDVLMSIRKGPKSKRSILEELGLTNHISNKQRHIDPLLAIGWMEYTNPGNPKDRNQKYRLTPAGLKLITLMKG